MAFPAPTTNLTENANPSSPFPTESEHRSLRNRPRESKYVTGSKQRTKRRYENDRDARNECSDDPEETRNSRHDDSASGADLFVSSYSGEKDEEDARARRRGRQGEIAANGLTSERDVFGKLGAYNHNDVPIDPLLSQISSTPLRKQHGSSADLPILLSPEQPAGEAICSRRNAKRKRHNDSQIDKDFVVDGSVAGYESNVEQADEAILGFEDEMQEELRGLGNQYTENAYAEDLRRHESQGDQQSQKRQRRRKQDTSNKTPNGKGFSDEETAQLDRFKDQYCRSRGITSKYYNNLIHANLRNNPQSEKLLAEIQQLFPLRTRANVQRFCRRRYHNFHARGKWTSQEDQDLEFAVSEKGTSWKTVGEMLDRFPEDCRDRYRNYLAPSAKHRNRETWSENEVIHLSQSILKCMELSKEQKLRDKQEREGEDAQLSKEDLEGQDLIDWGAVSNLMGRFGSARSRLQCLFKWGSIDEEDRDRHLYDVSEAQNNRMPLEEGLFTANTQKTSTGWRLRRASRKAQNMKGGDLYDIIRAIMDQGPKDEADIPWKEVGQDWFRRRWSVTEIRAAWLMMKRDLPNSEKMSFTDLLNHLLTKVLTGGIEDHWDPSVHGWVDENQETEDLAKQAQNGDMDAEQGKKKQEGSRNCGETQSGNNEDSARTTAVNSRAIESHSERSMSPNSLFDGHLSPELERAPAISKLNQEIDPELAQRVLSLEQHT